MADDTPKYLGYAGLKATKKFIEDTVKEMAIPDASETGKGAVRLMTHDETEAVLDNPETVIEDTPVALGHESLKAISETLNEFQEAMKQPLPSPEVEFIIDSARDTGKLYLKTNYSGAFGNVKVVMTPSSADPSVNDTEVTVAGTTVTANDNWQITAIQQDESSMYSNSLTSVVEITILKTQKPQISFQKATKKVWITCGTTGATV